MPRLVLDMGGSTTAISGYWRLQMFIVRRRLPHSRIPLALFLAAVLATAPAAQPAPDSMEHRCLLTVQSEPFLWHGAPILARVTVGAGGHLVATSTRIDGTDDPMPARFFLPCGDYEVTIDGDAGGGVGSLATTAVRLQRDQTMILDLR